MHKTKTKSCSLIQKTRQTRIFSVAMTFSERAPTFSHSSKSLSSRKMRGDANRSKLKRKISVNSNYCSTRRSNRDSLNKSKSSKRNQKGKDRMNSTANSSSVLWISNQNNKGSFRLLQSQVSLKYNLKLYMKNQKICSAIKVPFFLLQTNRLRLKDLLKRCNNIILQGPKLMLQYRVNEMHKTRIRAR